MKHIFISSTSLDLEEYRDAVRDAIIRLSVFPIDMKFFGSQSHSGLEASLQNVRQAHIFVGILAHRYGYVPEESTKSITEHEYDEAGRMGIPRLMYFVDPKFDWREDYIEQDEIAQSRLRAFKLSVEKSQTRSYFTTHDNLAKQVTSDLINELNKQRKLQEKRKQRLTFSFLLLIIILLLSIATFSNPSVRNTIMEVSGLASSTPTTTPSSTSTDTSTPVPTDTPTLTSTNTPTTTPTVTNTNTQTPTATLTMTMTNTATPISSPTPTNTSLPTPVPFGLSLDSQIRFNNEWEPRIRIFQEMNGMEMVLVPVGCFMMGSNNNLADEDENPVHQQCIEEPFWIGRFEVTNLQYGSEAITLGDTYPRDSIRWSNANEFCERIGGRLPTEVEWEFAARGPDNLVYPWGNDFVTTNVAYYLLEDGETLRSSTEPVGSFPNGRSWVGAMDMSGNLWEWTSSIYAEYPYQLTIAENSNDLESERTLRGGNIYSAQSRVSTTNRLTQTMPGSGLDGIGFRCARDFTFEDIN